MWDLVPRPGIKPRPPELGVWSLSHWTPGKSLQSEFVGVEKKIFFLNGPKVSFCHLYNRKVKVPQSCLFVTPWPVACQALLQVFPTQGWNPGSPHCRQILLPSEPPGKPKNTGVGSQSLLQWIFWPSNQINVSLIGGGFFTEPQGKPYTMGRLR